MKKVCKNKKTAAIVIALIFVLSILLGAFFACRFSSHTHENKISGNDCIICCVLMKIDELSFCLPVSNVGAAVAAFFAVVFSLSFCAVETNKFRTPISLKVKLTI